MAADNPFCIIEHLLCSRGQFCVANLHISSKVPVARIARRIEIVWCHRNRP